MKQKRIVVFGGTSAIAVACCQLWAQQGADFCLVGRDLTKLQSVSADLKVRGAREVSCIVANLERIKEHPALFREISAKFHEFNLALLAFGVLGDQSAAEREFAKAMEILDVNLIAPVSLLTELANQLEGRGGGDIVVISSPAGDRGRGSNYVYGAAKGGLTVFSDGLRARLSSKGVHLMTVLPGFVNSPMTRHLKQGPLFVEPEVVAKSVVAALQRRANKVYCPWFWWVIMSIIKLIPESIFKRLKI